MKKLIRDNYETIINPKELSIASNPERRGYLLAKLKEELSELEKSNYSDPDEFGDVIEVLYALGGLSGVTMDTISVKRLKKKNTLGAFNKGLILTKAE